MHRFFNWLRRHKPVTVYPRPYMVNILITHPRIATSIISTPVVIDAHSKQHAREQLKRELKIVVGRAVNVPSKQ